MQGLQGDSKVTLLRCCVSAPPSILKPGKWFRTSRVQTDAPGHSMLQHDMPDDEDPNCEEARKKKLSRPCHGARGSPPRTPRRAHPSSQPTHPTRPGRPLVPAYGSGGSLSSCSSLACFSAMVSRSHLILPTVNQKVSCDPVSSAEPLSSSLTGSWVP